MNKKTILLILIISISLLFFSACKKTARVEVENDGEIAIRATVAGSTDTVQPYSSVVWEVSWKSLNPNSTRTIDLYAEPIGFSGLSDSETVTLQNNDYYLWQTGWVYTAGKIVKSPKRKK